jgi:hypothetical protein
MWKETAMAYLMAQSQNFLGETENHYKPQLRCTQNAVVFSNRSVQDDRFLLKQYVLINVLVYMGETACARGSTAVCGCCIDVPVVLWER